MNMTANRIRGIISNRIITPIGNRFIAHYKLQDTIFFEGVPDFRDDARLVYDEMIRRGIHKKYKMLWAVEHPELFSDLPEYNTFFIKKGSDEWIRYSRTSKVLLSCNQTFYKAVKRKGQINYYLGHGAVFKNCGSYMRKGAAINYVNIISEELKKESEIDQQCSSDYFTYFGLPKNDLFYGDKVDLHAIFEDHSFKKCVIWMPTFRQNLSGNRVYSSIAQPIIHNVDDALIVNEIAKEKEVLVVLKPHFNQNMKAIKEMKLSNFLIVNDTYFSKRGVMMYEVLAAADGLLTDYSSVYWDFLNANKPIGLCWEDYEEFMEKCGLNINPEMVRCAAEMVNNMADLKQFLTNISSGIDVKREERGLLNKKINGRTAGKSSKMIVDYLEMLLSGKQEIRC